MKKIVWFLLLIVSSLNLNLLADTMQANIQQVKKRHEQKLLQLPGVVSVGIGLDETRKPVIIIGVETDDKETKSALPQQLEGYPVNIRYTGKVRAE